MIRNIIILILAILVWFAYTEEGFSSEQHEDQYCNIKTTLVRTVDQQGKVINEKSEEQVICDDGVRDFLQDAGIADSCRYYTWNMYLGSIEPVEQRSLVCHKLDGGYEIIPNYSGID